MYQSLENSICSVFPFQRNVCVTRCVTQLLVDSRSQCLLLNVTLSEQHSLPDRLVIGDTSYSLFFKGLLFRSLSCKTGKSFDTPLSQWASFLHEKQDVTQVLNLSHRVIVYRSEHPRLQLDWNVLRTYVVIIACAGNFIRLTMSFDIR